MPGCSTTALGHVGTGIGVHTSTWAHYLAPKASDSRVTHTCYDYTDANQKITAAHSTKGSLSVSARVYSKTTRYFCGNGACKGASLNSTVPARTGCTVARSGWHTWNAKHVWTAGAQTTKTLYYDKGGSSTQVSFHAF